MDRLTDWTLEQIRRELEKSESGAAGLEPPAEQRAAWLDAVGKYGESFLESIETSRAYRKPVPDDSEPDWSVIPEEAEKEIDALLDDYAQHVDTPGLNPASGGHIAYIPGGGLFPSALGDYMAAIGNRYAGVAYASPGAVRMENGLIRWMANLVGFPETSAGTLLSGGSLANLTAIVTARDAAQLPARDVERAVVYTTAQVHHCVDKALHYAGLAEVQRRIIDVDAGHRMRPDLLRAAIEKDQLTDGAKPWLIIASAGTTNTGAIDPLDTIADIAAEFGLWYHVDAAYGGFFMLSDLVRERLRGIERADSIVLDPHKGMFIPYGTGAVLVRDKTTLLEAHRYNADYMQDAAAEDISPAEISPELTRHFRGPRLWLTFQLLGLKPFRAALDEKILLARYAYELLRARAEVEVPQAPDLSVVAFRFTAEGIESNELNRQILERLKADGRIFLSSTNLNGQFTLRLAILAFRTHRRHIDLALQLMDAAYRSICASHMTAIEV